VGDLGGVSDVHSTQLSEITKKLNDQTGMIEVLDQQIADLL
jgi:hypothetical protein